MQTKTEAMADTDTKKPADAPASDIILPLQVIDQAPDPDAARPKRRLRPVFLLPLVLLLIPLGGVLGLYFQPTGLQRFFETFALTPGGGTDTPIAVAVERPAEGETAALVPMVVGLGRLVPQTDIRTLAPPFGAGDARIADLNVREGDQVAGGDILAVLDNRNALEQAVATARANVEVRTATLAQTRRNTESAAAEAEAGLQKAQAALTNAQAEFDRYQTLFERGIVTRAAIDQRQSTLDQATQEVERAAATASRYEGVETDEQVDVAVAKRNLDAGLAELERARADLEKAYIRAPSDGTVIAIHVQEGEKPDTSGVLDLGDISHMTAEIEIYQSDIRRVALGQPVTVTADAFDGELTGTVADIGLEVGRQTIIGDDPAANTDARVITVNVDLDEPSSQIAARFINLEVLARIETGPRDAP
ncbi:MAG: HlyD family efflux transporter periplasmic adaptor subunit [Roseitalea sp.]|jgi:HlyD family secretion protein|nr:HlyD family efflux transporter periplasmic adaptor subunit [Roseitalea sp.]MBO6722265.1 HlyD family efflux transporter periplasmic adaptor subunit [Roseitalea sp.]MBO6742406.1 HlyD family efflux transporter periplasmic adaptor subunit [Roseitalea sp.]